MYRYNVKFEEVGMLYVGSESMIDRVKSIKSNLMALFQQHNCHNVDGVDTYNACYGDRRWDPTLTPRWGPTLPPPC